MLRPISWLLFFGWSLLAGVALKEASAEEPSWDQRISQVMEILPHAQLGAFRLQRDPDRPILSYYGGIGLKRDENGEWTNYAISSHEEVDRLIQRCHAHGMTRICANIMFQTTASNLLGPLPEVSDDAMFAYAVQQAHAHGIEVYADVPVFGRRRRDEPFIAANPGVFCEDVNGDVDTSFFSPANSRVREYRIAVLMEALAQYPVDGIQLDFIRWESNDPVLKLAAICPFGYEPAMLDRFLEQHQLGADFVPQPEDRRFIQARADMVSLFIAELRQALVERGVSLPIGVYNSNGYGRAASLRNVCQDWQAWEQQNLVDEHSPMFYLDDRPLLISSLRSVLEIKRTNSKVFGPIFLDGPGECGPENVEATAREMIKAGCDGIWFCREMEVERYGLWPTVKRISEWSLSDVRSQQ